jgi:hypothetical protein
MLLIMQLSTASRHFLRHRYKWSQHLVLRHPSISPLSVCVCVCDQVTHPYKTAGSVMVLYILIFTFLERRREEERDSEQEFNPWMNFDLLLLSCSLTSWLNKREPASYPMGTGG